jgi:hypothetical protein
MNLFRPARMTWQPCAIGPNGPCVEVAFQGNGMVLLRRTRRARRGPVLVFTPDEWRSFVSEVKGGDFDDHPRSELPQASPLGYFVLQLIRDATVDENQHGLTLDLFRFVRTTGLAFAGVIIAGSTCFAAALACGSFAFGAHPHVAISLGASGGALFLVTATFQAVRCIRALLRALDGLRQPGGSPGGPPPHQDRSAA